MKFLIQLLLLTLSVPALGQINTSYRMTTGENKAWVVKVKGSDKATQLSLIKLRLIENRQRIDRTDRLVTPLLLIDGVQLEDSISQIEKNFLVTRLTTEIIDVLILEEQTAFHHYSDAGVVVLTIKDQKLSKDFSKLGRKLRKKR